MGLECSGCSRFQDPGSLQNLCTTCQRPLLARYDLDRAAKTFRPGELSSRRPDMWRYREVLPVRDQPVSLGEGFTPLRRGVRLGASLGLEKLYIKDESVNPTGSFKARGLSAAVSMARELGVRTVVVPTAGNAGMAMAAYAAAAGLGAVVYCPSDTPAPFLQSMKLLGATVHEVEGLITDCGARAREQAARAGSFDVSTLKEPYRIEGKKTMGYELAEQMGWQLPDVVIYPTGGGTGLVGMWKAFDEMESMGWINHRRPRMVSVQAAGCAPLVRAFHEGAEEARPWEDARTLASGLRVPAAIGDRLILAALRASGGTAVAVEDAAMVEGSYRLGAMEGILASPEGGATVAAVSSLLERGWLRPRETVVIFMTGTGLSYLESLGGACR
ncbi:MAG: threonine synthase [Acidobacteriota bacterium]